MGGVLVPQESGCVPSVLTEVRGWVPSAGWLLSESPEPEGAGELTCAAVPQPVRTEGGAGDRVCPSVASALVSAGLWAPCVAGSQSPEPGWSLWEKDGRLGWEPPPLAWGREACAKKRNFSLDPRQPAVSDPECGPAQRGGFVRPPAPALVSRKEINGSLHV